MHRLPPLIFPEKLSLSVPDFNWTNLSKDTVPCCEQYLKQRLNLLFGLVFMFFLKSFFFQFKFTPLSFAKGAEMLEINSSKPWQIRSNHSAWLYNLRGRWGNMKAQPASPSGCICMFLKKKRKIYFNVKTNNSKTSPFTGILQQHVYDRGNSDRWRYWHQTYCYNHVY